MNSEIFYAIQEGNKEQFFNIVKLSPETVYYLDNGNNTTLMTACFSKNIRMSIIKYLIKKIDINAENVCGYTALMFACKYTKSSELIRTLITKGAIIHKKNHYGQNAFLCWSCNTDLNKYIFNLLLQNCKRKDSIKAVDIYGQNVLSYSCKNKSITNTLLNELLTTPLKTFVNVPDLYGNIPLFYICSGKFFTKHTIKLFVKYGVNLNHTNIYNETIFNKICYLYYLDNFNVNIFYDKNYTTIYHNFVDITFYLVYYGINIYIQNTNGYGGLDYIFLHQHKTKLLEIYNKLSLDFIIKQQNLHVNIDVNTISETYNTL